jgi:hypothetical protein
MSAQLLSTSTITKKYSSNGPSKAVNKFGEYGSSKRIFITLERAPDVEVVDTDKVLPVIESLPKLLSSLNNSTSGSNIVQNNNTCQQVNSWTPPPMPKELTAKQQLEWIRTIAEISRNMKN